jgi:aspartyl aminopeptidase
VISCGGAILKKEEAKKLSEQLIYKRKNSWLSLEGENVFAYAKEYMKFIDRAKTERLAVDFLVEYLVERGFKPLESLDRVEKGERVYITRDGKSLVAAVLGENLAEGIDMVAAHLDAPRLDLKPYPLVEDSELAILKTHYYGGVKKYQWLNIPLAFVGTIVKKDEP